ncbi:hypothetical protein BASA60_011232 [Batrachochytrium salamandrivorans]|nr:hypothetical protein BASA60_011232 [Batrachochytrium salamandrivorans]
MCTAKPPRTDDSYPVRSAMGECSFLAGFRHSGLLKTEKTSSSRPDDEPLRQLSDELEEDPVSASKAEKTRATTETLVEVDEDEGY